jgi:opacity protein-like surface antigen
MKNTFKTVALATALVVGSLSFSAQAGSKMYAGIGLVKSKIDVYKKTNFKVLVGKKIDKNISVEGHYLKFGNKRIAGAGAIDTSGRSIGVAGLYHLSPKEDYSGFVKLGIHSYKWDETSATSPASLSGNGTKLFYGIGLDGKISKTMKYRVEYEILKVDGDSVKNIGASILFDF